MTSRAAGHLTGTDRRKQAVNQTRRVEALAKVPLFAGVSKRGLIRIDEITYVKTAAAGDVLMAEGDPGNEMMVVLEGSGVVTSGGREIGGCEPGQSVGEMALLDDQPRSATVTAAEPMRMLVIPGSSFRKMLNKVPGLTEALLATLSARLRAANAE